jgi:hypothetical protein
VARRVIRGAGQRAALSAFGRLVAQIDAAVAAAASQAARELRGLTPAEIQIRSGPIIDRWVRQVTDEIEAGLRAAQRAGQLGGRIPGFGGGSASAARLTLRRVPSLASRLSPLVNWQTETRTGLFRVLSRSVRLGEDAVQIARRFADEIGHLPAVRVAARVQRVEAAVRRAIASSGDPQALARARTSIQSVRRYAAQLGQYAEEGGRTAYTLAPPARRLARALNNAVRQRSDEAVDRAVNRFVRSKQAQHQRMTARTELARAYSDDLVAEAEAQGPWVVGFRWVVETGADRESDVCDLYAGQNAFGMGAGIYPVGRVPELPAHPNCMCHLDPVVDDAIGPNDKRPPAPPQREGAADSWLRQQPAAERDRIAREI